MSRRSRVLAIGWFGEGNLGDEAMLAGLLRLLDRALGPTDATVATADRAGTASTHGTRTIHRAAPEKSGFRNLGLVRSTLRADLVTLGGGDLIREQANGVVPALNWLSRLRVALALRRRTALLGVSVGELFSPRVISEVTRYLDRITLVAARDRASAARLTELSGRPVALIGDLALEALDPLPPRAPGGQPRIGLVTREILGRGPSVPPDASARLNRQLAAGLDRAIAETGARIELIPFRTRRTTVARDDDRTAGEAVASEATSGGTWLRHDPPRGVEAFARIAADVDLVLAVRLHGAVLGAAAGRRVIGIDYDPKVAGFLSDLGLPEQTLPLDVSAAQIADAIVRSLADPTLEDRTRAGVTAARLQTMAFEPELRRAVLGTATRSDGHPV